VSGCATLITLYSYPELFGVADNNGYGLKPIFYTCGEVTSQKPA
jgi:hypothetical protein